MFVEQLSKEDLIDYVIKYEYDRYDVIKYEYDRYARTQYDFNKITDYKVCEGKITFK